MLKEICKQKSILLLGGDWRKGRRNSVIRYNLTKQKEIKSDNYTWEYVIGMLKVIKQNIWDLMAFSQNVSFSRER